MVKAAAKAGIPTAVHESNMVPGLTTEMLELAGSKNAMKDSEDSHE